MDCELCAINFVYPPGNKLNHWCHRYREQFFFFTTVEVLKHGHQFYDTPHTEKKGLYSLYLEYKWVYSCSEPTKYSRGASYWHRRQWEVFVKGRDGLKQWWTHWSTAEQAELRPEARAKAGDFLYPWRSAPRIRLVRTRQSKNLQHNLSPSSFQTYWPHPVLSCSVVSDSLRPYGQ